MRDDEIIRVSDWARQYENNRTREMKTTMWFPVGNRLDDDAYVELVDHDDGPAHFGVFVAILKVASKSRPRGYLLRDTGRPHDLSSLARVVRMPRDLVEAAVGRLLELGKLEVCPLSEALAPQAAEEGPQEGAGSSQEGAGSSHHTAKNGTNGKDGIEGSEQDGSRRNIHQKASFEAECAVRIGQALSMTPAEYKTQRASLDAIARRISDQPNREELQEHIIRIGRNCKRSRTARNPWAVFQAEVDQIIGAA